MKKIFPFVLVFVLATGSLQAFSFGSAFGSIGRWFAHLLVVASESAPASPTSPQGIHSIPANPNPEREDGRVERYIISITPVHFASIYASGYQNVLNVSSIFQMQYNQLPLAYSCMPTLKEQDKSCRANKGFFIEPIGVFYDQWGPKNPYREVALIPFKSYTYGTALGWKGFHGDHFFFSPGIAYTHTNLLWRLGMGNATWSTLYLVPSFSWSNEKMFFGFLLNGTFNFISASRLIYYPETINIRSNSKYTSYDIMAQPSFGRYFSLANKVMLVPRIDLNFVYTYTGHFRESVSLPQYGLEVKSRSNFALQPKCTVALSKDYCTKKFVVTPNIYLGWLVNVYMGTLGVQGKFYRAIQPGPYYTFKSFGRRAYNQLVVGTQCAISKSENIEFSCKFEGDLLSQFEVFNTRLNFTWNY